MSYLVLARKSRPQFFREVVGQQSIVRTLQNALRQDRVAHALLFSGVRGTGKTTLARIMAKALNCENLQDAEPCNSCNACRQITAGGSVDLQEVDGASNRGIQEIRELKEKIRFMPTNNRYKIIIIDEVHMLTTEAFNALLKTLEEPPSHVFFMFATTELHKVPVTILSRCQRYELKRIGRSELFDHFMKLAESEGFQMEKGALDLIVREAGGSVRDGLSLLDQVFSYCVEEVKTEDVSEVLGLVDNRSVGRLVDALLNKDAMTVFQVIDGMYTQGVDLKRLSRDLLDWIRSLVICRLNPESELLDLSEDELAALRETVQSHSLETLVSMFGLLLDGLERAHFSTYSRLSLELVLLKIIQAENVVPVTDLLTRFDKLLAGIPEDALASAESARGGGRAAVAEKQPDPGESRGAAPVDLQGRQHVRADEQPTVQETTPVVAPPEPEAQQPVEKVNPEQEEAPPPPEKKQAPPEKVVAEKPLPESAGKGGGGKKDIRRDWDGFLAYVRDRQPWTSATLQRATSVKKVEEELVIQFDDSAECSLLRTKKYIKPLTEFLLDFFQENLTIRFEVPGGDGCAILEENGKQPQLERKALANDPLVLTAVEIFNGQVGDIRIGPRFRKKIDHEEQVGQDSSPAEV